MKWTHAFLFVLFFSCYSNANSNRESVVFGKVGEAIKKENNASISDDDYDDISRYISNGEKRWIDLYSDLRKEPFLGVTSLQEGLNISMAYALSKNPSEVLKFVDKSNIEFICGVPFIELTQDEINEYYSKTRLAILAVNSTSFWQDRCLFTLDKVMSGAAMSEKK